MRVLHGDACGREVSSKTDRQYIQKHLRKLGVTVDVRMLPLGDVLWVVTRRAQEPQASAVDHAAEWVCPFIVERKTAADLRSSITDTRYKEQKVSASNTSINCCIFTYARDCLAVSTGRMLRRAQRDLPGRRQAVVIRARPQAAHGDGLHPAPGERPQSLNEPAAAVVSHTLVVI